MPNINIVLEGVDWIHMAQDRERRREILQLFECRLQLASYGRVCVTKFFRELVRLFVNCHRKLFFGYDSARGRMNYYLTQMKYLRMLWVRVMQYFKEIAGRCVVSDNMRSSD